MFAPLNPHHVVSLVLLLTLVLCAVAARKDGR